jgi:hypothetical protein
MAVFLVVNSNLSVRLIGGIIQKHMVGKEGLIPLYVQAIFDNGAETERTLVVCDAKIAHLITRELNVCPLDPKITVTDDQVLSTAIRGFTISLPATVLLGAVQTHLLMMVGSLTRWFALEPTAVKLSYPGSSRSRDIHGGQAVLTVDTPMNAHTWDTMRFVLEHSHWPFMPVDTPYQELFFQVKWYSEAPKVSFGEELPKIEPKVPKIVKKPAPTSASSVSKIEEPKPVRPTLSGWAEKVKQSIPSRAVTAHAHADVGAEKHVSGDEHAPYGEEHNPYGVEPAASLSDEDQ